LGRGGALHGRKYILGSYTAQKMSVVGANILVFLLSKEIVGPRLQATRGATIPAFQAITVVMSRPIEQAVKMELGSWRGRGYQFRWYWSMVTGQWLVDKKLWGPASPGAGAPSRAGHAEPAESNRSYESGRVGSDLTFLV